MNKKSIRCLALTILIVFFGIVAASSFIDYSSPYIAATRNNIGQLIGLSPLQVGDSDSDGLLDLQEIELGTDPNSFDTDVDGLGDGWEVARGLDPLTYTRSTGEAYELLVIFIGSAVMLSSIAFYAVYYKQKNNVDRIDGMVIRRYSILALVMVFCAVIFIGSSVQAHGPLDPGTNNMTTYINDNESKYFNITANAFLSSDVTIEFSYNMPAPEFCTVTVEVYELEGSFVTSDSIVISYDSTDAGGMEWVAMSLYLEQGAYRFEFSYELRDPGNVLINQTRPIKADFYQEWADGRNDDQILWDNSKGVLVPLSLIVLAFGLIYFFYAQGGIRPREHIEILYPEKELEY